MSLSHLHSLSGAHSLFVAYTGQWANTNLDSSQKIAMGGPYAVRAYDVGTISGDEGYRVTTEYRYDAGALWQGQAQWIAFIDTAYVAVNRFPWASSRNSATLSGAGFGLNWRGSDHWTGMAYLASPIGAPPDNSLIKSQDSVRIWAEIVRHF